MKTTNNVQKTVKTKIQGILTKSAAVIISFVLISFTVSAHGFWKQILVNNSYGKMAVLMVNQQSETMDALSYSNNKASASSVGHYAAFNFIEPANDKFLALEDWMTEEYLFGSGVSIYEKAGDGTLGLESWMLDENRFSSNESIPETAKDSDLNVESWMVNDSFWSL